MANLLAEVAARGFSRLSRALRKAREEVVDDPEDRFIATARTYVTLTIQTRSFEYSMLHQRLTLVRLQLHGRM